LIDPKLFSARSVVVRVSNSSESGGAFDDVTSQQVSDEVSVSCVILFWLI